MEDAPSTLTDYVGVIRRRWWIAALVIAIATGTALLVSRLEKPKYEATAEVRLAAQPLATIVTGQHLSSAEAQRYAATQAQQADTPAIAALALRRANVDGLTPRQLLARSDVQPSATSDFLTVSVTDSSRARAKLLATSYATAFAREANNQAVKQIDFETAKLQRQAKAVQAKLKKTTGYQADLQAQYRQLLGTLQELQLARDGQAQSTVVAETAQAAHKVSPNVPRNLLMGAALGIVLALALMSIVEGLDRRVRDSNEIEHRLGLPMLGRVPTPPRNSRKPGHLSLLDDEGDRVADIFHRLRVSIDFANVKTHARTLMVTSAVEQEGKSTTAASLALALAGAGRRTALVDLDLRRPMLATFFGLSEEVGATTVMLGHATVEQALQSVPLPDSVAGPGMGSLHVMTTGPLPPNPSPLLEADATTELLHDLADRFDAVIVDSAPLLPVSDSVVLGGKVEGVVVIVRSEVVTRPILNDLGRALVELPTPKLGFVLTGADHDQAGYGYGYGYGYRGSAASQRDIRDDRVERQTGSSPITQLSSNEPTFDQS